MAQNLSKIDVSAVEFGDMTKQSTKPRNFVPLTPPLLVQVGVGKLEDDRGESLLISLPKRQVTVLRALEERLVDVAVQKKIPWFNKELDNDFMKGRFQSSISGENALILRKHADFQAFDVDREQIDAEDIDIGAHVLAVFELSYISFARAKFGGVFFLKQLMKTITPPACMVSNDLKHDDEADESVEVDDEL